VVSWLYGSGFPKSLDISKAIDKAAGAEREILGESPYNARRPNPPVSERYKQGGWPANITAPATPAAATWAGWGTALKPAWEPIILAMKPLDGTFAENALAWGVAGLNVDGARIAHNEECKLLKAQTDDAVMTGNGKYGQAGRRADVLELKPAGRWPANLILDEETAAYLDAQSGDLSSGTMQAGTFRANRYGWAGAMPEQTAAETYGDSGGASRFFYVAKAARSERDAGLNGMEALQIDDSREPDAPGANNPRNRGGRKATNFHPTVKPVELMRYLCRLTATPTGGIVLDPFMGSGTTGVACVLEGREFIGIDKEAHYCAIAEQRLATTQPALFGG
jgi:site-specific DNA-methyltransferase (adenine-specific)